MKLNEIVKTARAADSAAFGKINDNRAVKILRAAFRQVGNELESAQEGKVIISGLGRFTIKNVEREKNGVNVRKRRVIFRPGGKQGPGAKKRRAAKRKADSNQSTVQDGNAVT